MNSTLTWILISTNSPEYHKIDSLKAMTNNLAFYLHFNYFWSANTSNEGCTRNGEVDQFIKLTFKTTPLPDIDNVIRT